MEYREFGSTGLIVSAIGFGAGHIGGADMSDKEVDALLGSVLECGITLIDTARGYGLSEERIGKFLTGRRDEVVLSTKCGYDVPGETDWTYGCITKGIDLALERLRTDRIDIMHLHSCPKDVLERGEVIRALHEAINAGKILVAAYSGENEALQLAADSNRFGSVQCSVNICDQRVIDGALVPARRHELGVIAKRPLANAFWRHDHRPTGQYCEEYWERARKMGLKPGGLEWTELAIRFAGFVPGVHSLIVGTHCIDHLMENIRAIKKGALPAEQYDAARALFRSNDENWVGQV